MTKKRSAPVRTPDTRVRIPKERLDRIEAEADRANVLAAQLREALHANADLARLNAQGAKNADTVLGQAAKLVDGDRQLMYGDPKANFDCASSMAAAYLTKRGTTQIDAHDWAMLNVIGKIARQAHARTAENLVDMAGYVRTAEMVSG